MKRILTAASWLIPLGVIAAIWWPPIAHHHVSVASPPEGWVAASQRQPADSVLVELGAAKHALIPPLGRTLNEPVAEADAMLGRSGERHFMGHRRALVPFDPGALGALDYAMFRVPRTLLKAYEASGDELYFRAAREFILQFADYESAAWLPKGLMWNDHAIAVRVATYSEFWRIYRSHNEFDREDAVTFLRMVMASAQRLADPRQYTHASNHGTMQNLALLHLSIAFPALPGADRLGEKGLSRLVEQVGYMLSPEGIVLEHSAGYHRLGMELLGISLRYRSMMNRRLPPALVEKYERAVSVYEQLRASDDSLPPVGDTSVAAVRLKPLTTVITDTGATALTRDRDWKKPRAASWYADAGYAIWWSDWAPNAIASQTVFAWSRFPRHGHRHADELSLNIRSGDTLWWRGVGYWPLGNRFRKVAVSWTGSNAPHRVGESPGSAGESRMLAYGQRATSYFIDLERRGADGFRVRRQVLHLAPLTWLVLDAFDDDVPGRRARVVWSAGSDLTLSPGTRSGTYTLEGRTDDVTLRTLLTGSGQALITTARAQFRPFAGWVESDYEPTPADAVLVETSSGGNWLANVSVLGRGTPGSAAPDFRCRAWTGPDNWECELLTRGSRLLLIRQGTELLVDDVNSGEQSLLALRVPETEPGWAESSQAAYLEAERRYRAPQRDLIAYRKKATYVLLALLVLQGLVFWLARKFRWHAPWHAMSMVGWLVLGAWLQWSYLA